MAATAATTTSADKVSDAPAPLYERLGGAAAVDAAVGIFYSRVPVDPELARFFEGIDMKKLRNHQTQFLTMAFGGPKHYSGRTMAMAHKRLIEEKGLSNYHFDLVVGHLVATLKELNVDQSMIEEVAAICKPLRDAFPEPKA